MKKKISFALLILTLLGSGIILAQRNSCQRTAVIPKAVICEDKDYCFETAMEITGFISNPDLDRVLLSPPPELTLLHNGLKK